MTQYDLFGGKPPAQKHSPTSQAAALSIAPRIGPLHAKILKYLRERGGATDEQMQDDLHMGANTQRPRRRELQLWGHVLDSGAVRLTHSGRLAVVWIAA